MNSTEELFPLLHQLVDGRLSEAEQLRFSDLLRSEPGLIDIYAEYMFIHGQLHWDAGLNAATPVFQKTTLAVTDSPSRQVQIKQLGRPVTALAGAVLAMFGLYFAMNSLWKSNQNIVAIPDGGYIEKVANKKSEDLPELGVAANANSDDNDDLKPLELNNVTVGHRRETSSGNEHHTAVADNEVTVPQLEAGFTDSDVSDKIDRLLSAAWTEHGVTPSAPASDLEWIRRVYLTFAGRIPTLGETDAFLNQPGDRKYTALVDEISNSGERASNLAVVWTNLLVGRTEKRGVNREKLFDFLSDSFDKNQPWINVVGDLVTATGRNDQNGATNFLLAHLNNQATPATAVTSKLFLGEQLSCVQCHDHPFAKELKQRDYWALNAFFKDTDRVSVSLAMSDSGNNLHVNDIAWKLIDRRRSDRITYYETRSGLEKAVLPGYDNVTLPEASEVNRREELAKLLATDSSHKVARSMVNRMWAHFYGFGFTPEVDGMGPHATVSHPELLNLLTEAFMSSDYDLKRLMKWIANSRAWRLSSELTASNSIDAPASGEVPLFSRVYVRRMTPEQVYESIRVAIRSASGRSVEDTAADAAHRREWVAQFAQSYDTDENDESLDFDGTIAQAMVMMNGIDVDDAIRQATLAITSNGRPRKISNADTLDRVALAMLTREPTAGEKKVFNSHYRKLSAQKSNAAIATAVEDMMWAYLNSSEFVLVH